MVLYGQLVCVACSRILTYSLGALSCRCEACGTINPSQHIRVDCSNCSTKLVFPINTLEGLCPSCTGTIVIKPELLPPVPRPASNADSANQPPIASLYVQNPNTTVDGQEVTAMAVATKVL